MTIFPSFRQASFANRQRGAATLTIVVVVLLILLMVVPFAIRMGVFEERTSINDNRAALAASVADAALNQGTEYIKANSRLLTSAAAAGGGYAAGWLNPTTPRWQPCSTAAPAGQIDPCLAEPDAGRRALMSRYISGGSTSLPLAEQFGAAQVFTTVGGFNTTYVVGALLCRIDTQPGVVGAQPRCSLDPPGNGNVAITLVARATLPTENTTAWARQVIASFRVIGTPPNVPLVTANTLKGLGSAEIIPNPNAGGFGVPLSIWSNDDVQIDAGGTFKTCHLGEFLTNYTSNGPVAYDGITKCVGCGCKGLRADAGLLSGKDPTNARYEGVDILDRDGNTNGALPDSTYFPREPYDSNTNPKDDSMFEYVLGTDTTNEGATSPRTNCAVGNCENQFLIDLSAKERTDCSSLTSASAGLYWVHGDCHIGKQIGTPSNPVMVMVDGCVTANGQAEFYGMLYMRATTCTDPNAFKAAGGGQIYGAVVIDAPVDIAGSVQFIYNDTVLGNLGNSPDFKRYGVVPGTWTDQACFDANNDCQ